MTVLEEVSIPFLGLRRRHNEKVVGITQEYFSGKRKMVMFNFVGRLLHLKITINFELRPHQISFFPFLRKTPPTSPLNQTPNKLRIIPSPNKHLHLHLFRHPIQQQSIRKRSLPNKIFIIISLKRNYKLFLAMPTISRRYPFVWIFF